MFILQLIILAHFDDFVNSIWGINDTICLILDNI
jgi:hypothetical protein